MNDLIVRIDFWIAMLVAMVFKVFSSPGMGWRAVLATMVIGIGAALILTVPIVKSRGLDEYWIAGVGGFVAITFEHLTRQVLEFLKGDTLREIIKDRLGGKK